MLDSIKKLVKNAWEKADVKGDVFPNGNGEFGEYRTNYAGTGKLTLKDRLKTIWLAPYVVAGCAIKTAFGALTAMAAATSFMVGFAGAAAVSLVSVSDIGYDIMSKSSAVARRGFQIIRSGFAATVTEAVAFAQTPFVAAYSSWKGVDLDTIKSGFLVGVDLDSARVAPVPSVEAAATDLDQEPDPAQVQAADTVYAQPAPTQTDSPRSTTGTQSVSNLSSLPQSSHSSSQHT